MHCPIYIFLSEIFNVDELLRSFSSSSEGAERVGWASRPSFLFLALTGETPIPLFGNTPKFHEAILRPRSKICKDF
jgi:hypothetical protein